MAGPLGGGMPPGGMRGMGARISTSGCADGFLI